MLYSYSRIFVYTRSKQLAYDVKALASTKKSPRRRRQKLAAAEQVQ